MVRKRFCEIKFMQSTPEHIHDITTRAMMKDLVPCFVSDDYISALMDDGIEEGFVFLHKNLIDETIDMSSFVGKEYEIRGFVGRPMKEEEMPSFFVYQMEEAYA